MVIRESVAMLKVLFPDGIPVEQYENVLHLVDTFSTTYTQMFVKPTAPVAPPPAQEIPKESTPSAPPPPAPPPADQPEKLSMSRQEAESAVIGLFRRRAKNTELTSRLVSEALHIHVTFAGRILNSLVANGRLTSEKDSADLTWYRLA